MPAYRYEAVNTTGQRSTGTLEAADRGEAVRKLSRRGLQPFSLKSDDGQAALSKSATAKDRKESPPSAAGKSAGSKGAGGPIKLRRAQVIQFTEELCDLLTAGLQLEQALHSMENRSTEALRQLASALRERVRDGTPMSMAMHQVSPSFDELYCSLVAAGEAGGALGAILNRQARHLNQMEALRSKVVSALIYPAFIVASGVILAIVGIVHLLPNLAVLIQSTGKELPLTVQWVLSLSEVLRGWWWLFVLGVVLLVVTVVLLFQDKGRLAWWDRVVLRLPVYGPVLRTKFEVQFLETLGNLLKNGLPLHRALELVRRSTMNRFLRERLGTVESAVHDGGSLSRALEKAEVARPLVVDMVRVGEQTGEMADALEKAAERFDRQLSKVIDRATALLQPVIMLFMAGMVGGMAWMMISIVFSTLKQVNQR